ncbi:hypothetical protein C8R43DRAFT_601892 [Mycena crocata]|nr:hypothetical protein C8R43DRAFT_601892 [Mycena crocata]
MHQVKWDVSCQPLDPLPYGAAAQRRRHRLHHISPSREWPKICAFFQKKNAAGRHIPPTIAILRYCHHLPRPGFVSTSRRRRAAAATSNTLYIVFPPPAGYAITFYFAFEHIFYAFLRPFFTRKKPPSGTYCLRVQTFVAAITFQVRTLSRQHAAPTLITLYIVFPNRLKSSAVGRHPPIPGAMHHHHSVQPPVIRRTLGTQAEPRDQNSIFGHPAN